MLNWQLPLLFEDYYTILQHIGNFQDTKGDMSSQLVSLTPLKKRDSAMYSKRLLIDVGFMNTLILVTTLGSKFNPMQSAEG